MTTLSALAESNDATLPIPEIPSRFAGLVDDPLSRWDQTSLAEAHRALQLAYAETLNRLGVMKDAETLLDEIRFALDPLHGKTADILNQSMGLLPEGVARQPIRREGSL
jgi:hypothetical protein